MKIDKARVLLTGAAGGIGSEIAKELGVRGARVALLDRDPERLETLAKALSANGVDTHTVVVDLMDRVARDSAVDRAYDLLGGIDLLVNNAGLLSFRPFSEEDPVMLERIVHLNTLVPMMVSRRVLPRMLEQDSGQIVNIGSIFGSIGFAWFAAYSASKFGLRGFSEALRRELKESRIGVTYVAPRAVRTPLNSGAVYRMAEATNMQMDEPARVAADVVRSIEVDAKDVYLGWPEKMFVRINALLPRLVDGAVRKQSQAMGVFAREV